MQNAIELLQADHVKVRKLLSELVESSDRAGKKRQQLLEEIGTELRLHTAIEEEIFYPAFRKASRKAEQPMIFEAKEEHRAVENVVLPDLEKTDPETDEFTGYARVLKEFVEHHAEEEETEMFKLAQELMSQDQLVELGKQMQEMKDSRSA